MSLINDALKRAREAQQRAPEPVAVELHLRPVEPPASHTRHNLGALVPAALALLALGGLLLIWLVARRQSPPSVEQVAAKTPVVSQPVSAPAPEPRAPVAAAAPVKTVPVPAETAPSTNALPAAVATNAAPIVAPSPKPVPPRLQAIVYTPKRPSAMVDGKTLFVGDRLGQFRVYGITPQTVTLVAGSVTNVLSLSE